MATTNFAVTVTAFQKSATYQSETTLPTFFLAAENESDAWALALSVVDPCGAFRAADPLNGFDVVIRDLERYAIEQGVPA